MRGISIDIQVRALEECGRCHGKGAEPEDGLTTCPICRGKGEVIYQQAFFPCAALAISAEGAARSFAVPARNVRAKAI